MNPRVGAGPPKRHPGMSAGQVWVSEDVDDDSEIIASFEGEDGDDEMPEE